MFGLGFGEILILLIVAIVVVGPRNLPPLMRQAGKWVSKLRRMSTDLRTQSGIDDLIRQEGLERELQEIRSLSRVNIVDTLMAPALAPAASAHVARPAVAAPAPAMEAPASRDREYPLIGCDAYGALADDVTPPPDLTPEPPPEAPAAQEVPS